ncbi:MAG TPA: hypothetical protein VF945_05960 [Polyangia bacterium]
MRAAALGLALVALAGCRDRFVFACNDDSQCVRSGAHGSCTPSPVDSARYCAFADPACPAGRWDATAPSSIAGACVGEEMLDMSAGGGDGGSTDLAIPAYGDLAFNGDAAINVNGCTTTAELFGVWGPNTDDVWVVGAQGTIFHYAGGGCEVQTTGVPSVVLRGVWGRSANDVFVVGDGGTILHSVDKGKHWSNGSGQNPSYGLWGVGGTATKTFAAVENMGGGGVGAAYASGDGATWTIIPMVPLDSSGSPLDTFWSTATDSWVAGGNGDVYHFDGSNWSGNVGTTAAGGYFSGLAGIAPSTLLGATSHGQIFRYAGSWTNRYESLSTNVCANGMYAIAAVPGRAVAVGKYGCIAVSADDGVTWRAFDFGGKTSGVAAAAPNMHDYNAVWIDAPSQSIIVVGAGGVIEQNPQLP